MNELKHTILCIDDEQNIQNALKRLLRKEKYRLLTCSSGKEGLEVLANTQVHLVISDQRMPEMSGTDFLKQVKERYPDIIRIILTGYTDVDTITRSINEGHIYKFFLKPWNDQHLTLEIRQALEQYELIEANKKLARMTVQQNEELRTINENLEAIVAERTSFLEIQNRALQLSQAVLENLPLPIIGVSSEMMIVLVNKAAQVLLCEEFAVCIGNNMDECFDGLSIEQLALSIANSERSSVTGIGKQSGKSYEFQLLPLSGQFSGRGIVITITTC